MPLIADLPDFGIARLRDGWRKFSVFISGYAVLVIPIEFLAILLSSDFKLFISRPSGIDSWIVLEFVLILAFAIFLWMFVTLTRPNVKKGF